jgi:hypothetical protein
MQLGLIADIHESVDLLRSALRRFRAEGVEQVIVLGDVFEMGLRIEETCRLLAEARAIGVWGNHDFGLCVEPSPDLRARYSSHVLDFMASLRPRLEIADCLFTHVEPWLDPEKLEDLWYFDGVPDSPDKLDRIFRAAPHRLLFAGHFHRWLLATPAGIDGWPGDRPLRLTRGERYFVVVHALCEGFSAILDTETWELVPFRDKT